MRPITETKKNRKELQTSSSSAHENNINTSVVG
eukprot:CAMPEP_0185029342 /NCGR_PEP_ID=MMETSP1103-20130426/15591_1 /TAXON_ID=36769 /ORGANISM="Paraphysomonas bandaiensis, Strain Caron Lab Isolate" /LENGTH=32 /DNA_ID= /DNA_START= /DNA_END= /DNA_ORIENTATION=